MTKLVAAFLALSDMAAALGIADRFVSDVRGRYRLQMRILIQQVWNGEIDDDEFQRRAKDLLTTMALAALIAGLFDAGYSQDELDDGVAEQTDEMNAWVEQQMSFMPAFAKAVLDARSSLDQRLPILGDRLGWWVASLESFQAVSTARTPQRRDEMLTFAGDDGKESCDECQAMKGRRYAAKHWIDNDLVPGIPGTKSYSCGGWRCDHFLQNDDGVRRLP